MFLEHPFHASIPNRRRPSLLPYNARAGRGPGYRRSVVARPHSDHPCGPATVWRTESFPFHFFSHDPGASARTLPHRPRSGSRRLCSRRRRCAMDESLGESRASARLQHWGDLAIFLAVSQELRARKTGAAPIRGCYGQRIVTRHWRRHSHAAEHRRSGASGGKGSEPGDGLRHLQEICGVAGSPDLISRVVDVVQQQSKGWASGCEVSVLSHMIDTERMEALLRIVRRVRAIPPAGRRWDPAGTPDRRAGSRRRRRRPPRRRCLRRWMSARGRIPTR